MLKLRQNGFRHKTRGESQSAKVTYKNAKLKNTYILILCCVNIQSSFSERFWPKYNWQICGNSADCVVKTHGNVVMNNNFKSKFSFWRSGFSSKIDQIFLFAWQISEILDSFCKFWRFFKEFSSIFQILRNFGDLW